MSPRNKLRPHVAWSAGLALVGLAANPWLIGWTFSPVGKITKPISLACIFALQAVCLLLALLVYRKGRTSKQRRRIVFGLLTVGLVLAAAEAGLHLLADTLGVGWVDPGRPHWADAAPYRSAPWASAYVDEYRDFQGHFAYHPYLGWSMSPFRGRYIHFDPEAGRRTWRPAAPGADRSGTVYVFGGSTLWGEAARDEGTIPSFLAKRLAADGRESTVRNYGIPGHASGQELVRLLLLLKDGHRPDWVIFYDGFNDAYAAYEHGRAGVIYSQATLERRFRNPADRMPLRKLAWIRLANTIKTRCMLYRSVQWGIQATLGAAKGARNAGLFGEVGASFSDAELRALAEDVVAEYLKVVEAVDRLAGAYGFRYLFLWQPTIFTEDRLLEGETDLPAPRTRDPALRVLCRAVTEIARGAARPGMVVISDALKDRTGACYLDYCHVNEEGNRLIAGRIADLLQERWAPPASGPVSKPAGAGR